VVPGNLPHYLRPPRGGPLGGRRAGLIQRFGGPTQRPGAPIRRSFPSGARGSGLDPALRPDPATGPDPAIRRSPQVAGRPLRAPGEPYRSLSSAMNATG